MAQKEQFRVMTGDHLGAKVIAGAPAAGGGVVVEVREKKGPLRAAIPTMPFPLAVICLFLNTFIPGLGISLLADLPGLEVWGGDQLLWKVENWPPAGGLAVLLPPSRHLLAVALLFEFFRCDMKWSSEKEKGQDHGTFISAFTVLCGARSELISERGVCCVFWLNVAAALIQILTAVIMVGWIMSIFWGMDMVILA
ncbi:hypothetical protein FQN60_015725, partial [Etheostoma spectabile]